jgi:hypothetical protein
MVTLIENLVIASVGVMWAGVVVIVIKPRLRRPQVAPYPIPFDSRRNVFDFPIRLRLADQFQMFQRHNGNKVVTATANDHGLTGRGNLAEHCCKVVGALRFVNPDKLIGCGRNTHKHRVLNRLSSRRQ